MWPSQSVTIMLMALLLLLLAHLGTFPFCHLDRAAGAAVHVGRVEPELSCFGAADTAQRERRRGRAKSQTIQLSRLS